MAETQPAQAGPGRWLTSEVWLISLSAFCADLGYQAVLAVFPLFLVLSLHAPVVLFGVATAVAYGPGALVAYLGGRIGDRVGRRRTAIWGNAFIPLLSLIGLAAAPLEAIVLLALGWWARSFRSAPRRAMLTEAVEPVNYGRAFGFLHALDVGGGALAALYALLLVSLLVSYRVILLVTLVPLVVSTILLPFVRRGLTPAPAADGRSAARAGTPARAATGAAPPPADLAVYRGVLLAAALYGFSSYSAGFPILTIAQSTGSPAAGVLAYFVLLAVSSLVGLIAGPWARQAVRNLSLLGYLAAAVGSAAIGAAYALHWGVAGLYPGMALLGLGLGVVETLEPTLVARLAPQARASGALGSLTAARSVGLFTGNIVLGLLYHFGPAYSYGYATVLGMVAAAVLLVVGARARGLAPAAGPVGA